MPPKKSTESMRGSTRKIQFVWILKDLAIKEFALPSSILNFKKTLTCQSSPRPSLVKYNPRNQRENDSGESSSKEQEHGDYDLFHPKSTLIAAPFEAIFNPEIWQTSFSDQEREELMRLLHPSDLIPEPDSDVKESPSNTEKSQRIVLKDNFFQCNISVRENWSSYKEHLAMGLYVHEVYQKRIKERQSDEEKYNQWKEDHFEEEWGDRQDLKSADLLDTGLSLRELCMAKAILVNDLFIYFPSGTLPTDTHFDYYSATYKCKVISIDGSSCPEFAIVSKGRKPKNYKPVGFKSNSLEELETWLLKPSNTSIHYDKEPDSDLRQMKESNLAKLFYVKDQIKKQWISIKDLSQTYYESNSSKS